MKKINIYTKCKGICLSLLALLALTLNSCDLELQENFEYVSTVPDIPINAPTAYDWIQQDPEGIFANLKAAIDLLGMEADFRAPDRTFFLLMDSAWDNGIWFEITGNDESSVADIMGAENADKRDLLKRILTYHIVDMKVDQFSLPKFETQEIFQSLLPGESGQMAIHRQFSEWNMTINNNDSRKPGRRLAPGGSKKADIKKHNVLFANGTSHYLDRVARWGDNWDSDQ